jgi:hypothetical protein
MQERFSIIMAILFNNKVEVRIATRRGAVAGGVRALRCERHVNNGLSIVDVFEKSASVVLMHRHWPLASEGVFARSYVQSTSACCKPWISRCVKRSGMMPTSQPREQESAKTAVIAFLLQYTATLAATRIFAGFCKLDTHTNFIASFSLPTPISMSSLDTDLLTPVAVAVIVVAATILYYTKFRHPVALKPTFQAWPLIEKEVLSHDTRRFTFAFPSPNMKLGLPVGQHMTLQFVDENGKAYQRSYTPVSHELGKVSFCIKVYKPMPPKFPNGGTVSQHLDSLKIGDTMNIKGPKGHLEYFGKGKFAIHHNRKPTEYRVAKEIGMIAGGTGITPMLQVLHAIFENPNDQTKCKLLYANQST